ncbi:Uncharacterized protein Fot_22871 [Forsythia ovata]|uniref:Uncharacterized protein n=1 Tax=Forsythia ovata TaxID=205694 RepID=A0ABD1V0S0_9LAMI
MESMHNEAYLKENKEHADDDGYLLFFQMNTAESCSKVCEPTLLTKKELQNKRRRELYAQTKEARNTCKKELSKEAGELHDKRKKERHSQQNKKCGNRSKQLMMKQLNHKRHCSHRYTSWNFLQMLYL